jgi:hypothetical protein
MVQRVQVTTLCDVDDVDEGSTFSFALRGVSYEIDLCDRHLKELEGMLEPFIDSGRRIGGRRQAAARTAPPAARPAPSAPADGYGKASNDLDKDARIKVREWAKSNGFEVGDRGRISQDIYNAYQEAHA